MNKKLAEVQEAAAAATTAAAAATLAANEKMQVVDAKDAQITELHQKKNEAQVDASSAKAAKAAGEETIRHLGRELEKTQRSLSEQMQVVATKDTQLTDLQQKVSTAEERYKKLVQHNYEVERQLAQQDSLGIDSYSLSQGAGSSSPGWSKQMNLRSWFCYYNRVRQSPSPLLLAALTELGALLATGL
jgi:chromosome segregation ATPase